jgi:hypothetical protein
MPPKRKNSVAAKDLPRNMRANGQANPDAPLTELQRKFVMHLVHDKMTQTAAARAAGFGGQPGVAATMLMKSPKIQGAIAREREEYAKASGVTKQKVIDGFLEAVDLGRIKADPIAMIAGWREVGKMCGFYEPTKTEIKLSVNGQVMIQKLNGMTDEELLALAEKDPRVLEGDFSVVDGNG